MSEGARIRLVAVGAALVALLFTLVAVIVVLTRDSEPAKSANGVAAVIDHVVKATDLVRLQKSDPEVELVVERGVTKGLRIKDAALAKTLGLDDGDLITAMTGKQLTREFDVYQLILKASVMNATTIYVEVARKDPAKPSLVRWKLDGDLHEARLGARYDPLSPSYRPPSPSYPSPIDPFASPDPFATPHPTPDPIDPLLDGIEKVDDTHVRVPNKTLDAVLANPMAVAKGARVVPAMRNGQPEGFKLYAIRPSSMYARLGFQNGDTIHSINGFELTSADKALEVYTKLRDATSLSIDITRRGKPVELTIEITK